MSKYDKLVEFLNLSDNDSIILQFHEIEKIIGESLPPSAYQHNAWWANDESHSHMKPILDSGWKTQNIDLKLHKVEFVKTFNQITNFDELKNFILNAMKMEKGHNYQPVMLRTILENKGAATKEQIIEQLQKENPKFERSYFNNSPVFEVLVKHRVVTVNKNKQLYQLNNAESYHQRQLLEGIKLCNDKITEANKIREDLTEGKIAICWSIDRDYEKIEKFQDIIQKHGKVLWGVNWNAPQIKKSDFPVKGYIYHQRQIIAVAEIIDITSAHETPKSDLELRPRNLGYQTYNYDCYLHFNKIQHCRPFPHTVLEMFNPQMEMPDRVQQRIYVKELKENMFHPEFHCWIWSVTPENWKIVQQKHIWASKIGQNIRERIRPNDKVVFYVIGTNEFQGIFELVGDWYDATEPVWADEMNSVIYQSQTKLTPVKFGKINVYDIAPKMQIFSGLDDNRLINHVLNGGGGYPSNNGKPIPYDDYQLIYNAIGIDELKEKFSKKLEEGLEELKIIMHEEVQTFEDVALPVPTTEEIESGYEKISEELLIPKTKVIEIITALASVRHVLLAGPIGTGKTELARKIPAIFWEKYGGYCSEDHTATSDWSTQDVIGGIFPKMGENGNPVYEIQNGCVVETVQKNWLNGVDGGPRRPTNNSQKDSPYRGTWLTIDEFNRADIDKAFGQLFTALRTRTLKIPTDIQGESYKILRIPEDYRIIGTLNTADKHFLFQLSDALKSRFSYIEIDIPKREEFEQEIYYAMKNAIAELKTNDYEDLVVLDHQNKKINKEKTNPEFYNRIYQAYHFLDLVRMFKKLGTAILKLVYQNLLVGTKITGDLNMALDNSLKSNLIPQLENLSRSAIGAIHSLYATDVVKFFKDAYKNPNRQSYADDFAIVLNYLQLPNAKRLGTEFSNGTLQVDNDSTWQPIQTAHDNKKKDFELDLNQLKQSMEELVKSIAI